jgi:hypothetical protein
MAAADWSNTSRQLMKRQERHLMMGDGGRRYVVPSHRYELVFIGSWQCEAGNREMERPAVVE